MYLILIYLKLLNNIIKPRVIPFTVPFVYMYCEEEIVIPDTCHFCHMLYVNMFVLFSTNKHNRKPNLMCLWRTEKIL